MPKYTIIFKYIKRDNYENFAHLYRLLLILENTFVFSNVFFSEVVKNKLKLL